jgi:hypothetical protein
MKKNTIEEKIKQYIGVLGEIEKKTYQDEKEFGIGMIAYYTGERMGISKAKYELSRLFPEYLK